MLVLFPHSDLRSAKRRPALVVQANALGTGMPQKIAAMITTTMARADHPSRVKVLRSSPEGRQSGLRTDSVIVTDNLATVLASEIDSVVGRLTDMSAVDEALRHTLAL